MSGQRGIVLSSEEVYRSLDPHGPLTWDHIEKRLKRSNARLQQGLFQRVVYPILGKPTELDIPYSMAALDAMTHVGIVERTQVLRDHQQEYAYRAKSSGHIDPEKFRQADNLVRKLQGIDSLVKRA